MMKLKTMSVLVALKACISAKFSKAKSCGFSKVIKNADARTLGEISFELDKRAGKLKTEAIVSKRDFEAEFAKKIATLNEDERDKFKEEFKVHYNEKVSNLSIKEAKELGLELIS